MDPHDKKLDPRTYRPSASLTPEQELEVVTRQIAVLYLGNPKALEKRLPGLLARKRELEQHLGMIRPVEHEGE